MYSTINSGKDEFTQKSCNRYDRACMDTDEEKRLLAEKTLKSVLNSDGPVFKDVHNRAENECS